MTKEFVLFSLFLADAAPAGNPDASEWGFTRFPEERQAGEGTEATSDRTGQQDNWYEDNAAGYEQEQGRAPETWTAAERAKGIIVDCCIKKM